MISKGHFLFTLLAIGISVLSVAIASPRSGRSPASLTHLALASMESATRQDESESAEDDEKKFPPAEDLIKDWEKPELALFISGRLHGYIEPCGCVGLDRQKGGLLRRHTVQNLLKDRGWNLVSIDAGNQIKRFSEQALIKMQTIFIGLCKTMKYDAVGIGPDDLSKASSLDLAQRIMDNCGENNPFVCANIFVLDETVSSRFLILESGGHKIGVTSLVGDEHLASIRDGDVTKESVAEGLKRVIPQLQAAGCDLLVCTVHSAPDKCVEIAKNFPVFDLMVCAGGPGDPKALPERIPGGNHITQLIYAGKKGMHVGVVGYYGDRSNLKYERVPLDARFKDSEVVKEQFIQYQQTLENRYRSGSFADIKPKPHPTGHSFVGSDACATCHQEEYDIWEKQEGGPHTHATRDLEVNPNNDRMWVKRNYDPECLSCHVTGWDPQNFYPFETGFLDHDKDTHLTTSGCENCHGPGSEHIRIQELVKAGKLDKKSPEARKTNREVRLTKARAKKSHCMSCHDLDNSPDFLVEGAFAEYWKQIEHGKGKVLRKEDE